METGENIFRYIYCYISIIYNEILIAIKIFLLNILHSSEIPRIFVDIKWTFKRHPCI